MEVEKLLDPIRYTTRKFYVVTALLVAGIGVSLYAWGTQLTQGLVVTDLRDIGVGTPWGLYISNFVFGIAVSHAGIALSAAVRIANLPRYKPITRMAELLTITSLMMAMLMIITDIGRPDRIFYVVAYWPERVGQSPLAWDIIAVFTYFALSTTYLYITMREDIAFCLQKIPKFKRLYKLLLPFYRPGEKEKMQRIAFWMAICILPVMVFVHSTVAWIFGLMSSQPGWFGSVLAPYFVVGAIANGIATIIVVAAAFRWVFKWDAFIPSEIFRGMGNILAVVVVIYLYFMVSEVLTIRFAGPAPEIAISQRLLFGLGPFTWAFWCLLVGGLIVPFLMLFAQAIDRKLFSVKLVFTSAFLIDAGLWFKRILITVPSLLTPSRLPYPWGVYVPTWVEWSIVAVTFVIPILLYMLFIKIFPIVPISELREVDVSE